MSDVQLTVIDQQDTQLVLSASEDTQLVLSTPGILSTSLMMQDGSNSALALGSAGTPSLKFAGDANTGIFSPGADQVSISTGGTERLRIDSAGQIEAVSLGSAAAPTFSFTGDPNTGVYSPGADQLAISTGGLRRLFIQNNEFRFGAPDNNTVVFNIGNEATGDRAVYTDLITDTTYTDFGLRLGREGGANSTSFLWHRGTGDFLFLTSEAAPIKFSTSGVERLRIDSSGRLLVGTSSAVTTVIPAGLQVQSSGANAYASIGRWDNNVASPGLLLNKSRGSSVGTRAVVQSGDILGEVSFMGDDGTSFITGAQILSIVDGTPGSTVMPGRLIFSTTSTTPGATPTERMRITSAGLVGIGTTAPGVILDVRQNQATYSYFDFYNITAGGGIVWRQIVRNLADTGTTSIDLVKYTSGGFAIANNDTGAANFTAFSVGASERLRITSAGRVGIGTTAPSFKLDVVDPGTSTVRVVSSETSGSSIAQFYAEYVGSGASNTQFTLRAGSNYSLAGTITSHPFIFATGNAERARIDSSGRLLVGTSASVGGTFGNAAPIQNMSFGAYAVGRFFNDASAPVVDFVKSRNGTIGSHTVVQSGDSVGDLYFSGSDGTAFIRAAQITAQVDGTPGANDMPGRLVFSTTADGAASPTERMRITSAGLVGIGTAAPVFNFVVAGSASDGAWFNSSGTVGRMGLGAIANGAAGAFQISYDRSTGLTNFGVGTRDTPSTAFTIDSSGRLGIGASSPSYALDVSSGDIRLKRSAANNAALYFGATTNNYIYGDSDNNLFVFATNGSERARIDPNGKLLVGTSASIPGAFSDQGLLQVNGGPAAGYAGYRFTNDSGGAIAYFYKSRSTTTGTNTIVQNGDTCGSINFAGADGTTYHRAASITGDIDGTPGSTVMPGRLVFSTTSTTPGASPTERMRITSAGTTTLTSAASTAPFIANIGASEVARIDSSGRLLVGTSTARANLFNSTIAPAIQLEGAGIVPAQRFLSVINNFATAGDGGGVIVLGRSKGGTVGSNTVVAADDQLGRFDFQGSDGTEFVTGATIEGYVDGTPGANDMPGRLVFSTTADGAASLTERMRIGQSGYMKLSNTGSYIGPAATYHEISGNAGSGSLTLAIANTSATGNGVQINSNSDGTSYVYLIGYSTSASANRIVIWSNGNVINTNNSYGAISDIKLKENIVDANSQWDDLKALQVRNYNFKEGQTHTQIGLVAQEVELVSPGLVTESPDRDEDGNDLGTVTKSVNYSVLYMKAVKALQEAMERIEQLEAKVAALEAQ